MEKKESFMIDITSRDENGVHIVEFDGKLNTNTSFYKSLLH